jgi:hypothetical protein
MLETTNDLRNSVPFEYSNKPLGVRVTGPTFVDVVRFM